MSSFVPRASRTLLFSIVAVALALVGACHGGNDVTGTGGSLVHINVDAPDTATSGQPFNVNLTTQNVGVSSVNNGVVTATLPAPLSVTSVNAASGTSATFSNSSSGATVTWQVGTLGANSGDSLTVQTVGTLAPGSANMPLAIQAQLTATGISPGEDVATDSVTLMP